MEPILGYDPIFHFHLYEKPKTDQKAETVLFINSLVVVSPQCAVFIDGFYPPALKPNGMAWF